MRILLSHHLHQYFLLMAFLFVAILVGVQWYLIVILTYISLITNDAEYLFIFLLAIWRNVISDNSN